MGSSGTNTVKCESRSAQQSVRLKSWMVVRASLCPRSPCHHALASALVCDTEPPASTPLRSPSMAAEAKPVPCVDDCVAIPPSATLRRPGGSGAGGIFTGGLYIGSTANTAVSAALAARLSETIGLAELL